MKHLFGPVNSRRLGLSLGIDLVPPKICNLNCIYCEVGATTTLTCERKEYTPLAELFAEIDQLLADQDEMRRIDIFTITGSGEPTLHSGIDRFIAHLKEKTDKPVAVLTNGTLLHLPEVRRALLMADIVIPSLDAAREESFRRVNRPAGCVPLAEMIDGMATFKREFQGEFWLEILLVGGINDDPADIEALAEAAALIGPDKIQLNSVARPPLESFARPVSRRELEAIAARLPGPVEILIDFGPREEETLRNPSEDAIIALLRRRPCTAWDVSAALGLKADDTQLLLDQLAASGRITKTTHHDKQYYQ